MRVLCVSGNNEEEACGHRAGMLFCMCCGLNVYASSEFLVKPNLHCNGIRGWCLCCESGALINRVSGPYKEAPLKGIDPPQCSLAPASM